jgi:hypothetical protein
MTGKSKTETERRQMRERCEKIAVKYRGTGTYTDLGTSEDGTALSADVLARIPTACKKG